MKLLFCCNCGDIIVPSSTPRHPRYCSCGTHAFWWENPVKGIARVWDQNRIVTTRMEYDTEYTGPPNEWNWNCWVIGLHNQWLINPTNGRYAINEVLALTPDSYIFHRDQSIAIKVRPGQSNDTAYADLPKEICD